MKEIGLDELRKLQLAVLQQVNDICKEQGLRYSMCGGTLLGAVRHNGYIPWDDDIDIVMPRPDYQKLIEYSMKNELPFKLMCHQNNERFCDLYAKAYDKRTVIIEESANRWDNKCGVYIDIFPADGLGNSFEEAQKTLNLSRFNRELLVAANWKKFKKSKTHSWYIEPVRFAFFLLSRFVNPKKLIEKIEKTYISRNFDDSNVVGVVCGSYRDRELMPIEYYSEFVLMKFEGREFQGLKNYDGYLKKIYGDYMQLPPENKRITHHSFTPYYID